MMRTTIEYYITGPGLITFQIGGIRTGDFLNERNGQITECNLEYFVLEPFRKLPEQAINLFDYELHLANQTSLANLGEQPHPRNRAEVNALSFQLSPAESTIRSASVEMLMIYRP